MAGAILAAANYFSHKCQRAVSIIALVVSVAFGLFIVVRGYLMMSYADTLGQTSAMLNQLGAAWPRTPLTG